MVRYQEYNEADGPNSIWISLIYASLTEVNIRLDLDLNSVTYNHQVGNPNNRTLFKGFINEDLET